MKSDQHILLANQLGEKLKFYGWKIAVAESCTGGGLCYLITSVPGSSAWFDRGFIVYSNEAKKQMLALESSVIEQHGAVSEEVAKKLAEQALALSKADVSIAITGIAGPDGGTIEKPVGTIWIAYAKNDTKTIAEHHRLSGDRQSIRERAILQGLNKLLLIL